MAVFYVLGVLAAFTYNRIMATVTQGTLKHLRDDMFHGMETLPIPYFDTHPYGDIMSTYTNDTDAIRMLIGQSLPMLIAVGAVGSRHAWHDAVLQCVDDHSRFGIYRCHADNFQESSAVPAPNI